MTEHSFGATFIAWAQQQSVISGLILIGSRARATGEIDAADAFSDWDFQIITAHPKHFAADDWVQAAGLPKPDAYAVRPGRLTPIAKASIVFPEGELDLVVIPARGMRWAKFAMGIGVVRCLPGVWNALSNLALVLRPGYRVLKGHEKWGAFLNQVVNRCTPAMLSDAEICALAEGFVADYVSTRRKLQRGELLAAQRWLHQHLAETNFRLLGIFENRKGRRGLPDARRLERSIEPKWLAAVAVSSTLDEASLSRAVEQSAATLRALMAELVGPKWAWPRLNSRLRAE